MPSKPTNENYSHDYDKNCTCTVTYSEPRAACTKCLNTLNVALYCAEDKEPNAVADRNPSIGRIAANHDPQL